MAATAPLKGRPPLRKVPDDFRVIFVEKGRDGCEVWYRASRKTVNRWMAAVGSKPLIDARAAYVAHQRANGQWITRSTRLVETRPAKRTPWLIAIRDRRKINPTVARHAAQFLRVVRHGGFIISPTPNGDWWVGSRRLSAAQMLDLAVSKGFEQESVPTEPTEDDRIIHRPENLGTARAATIAQRPDGSTYIPNLRRQEIVEKANLHGNKPGRVKV